MTRKVQGKSDRRVVSQHYTASAVRWSAGFSAGRLARGAVVVVNGGSYSSTAVCRSSIKWTPEHTEVRPSVEKRLCCPPGQQCWFTATRLASGQPFALSFPACLLVVSSTISTARLVGVSLKSWEELENNADTML